MFERPSDSRRERSGTRAAAGFAMASALALTLACGKHGTGKGLLSTFGGVRVDDSAVGVDEDKLTARAQSPNGVEYGVVRTAQNRVKLGDRFYVASVLSQVFGPESDATVNALIRNNPVAFGGPCDQFGREGGNGCAGRLSSSQVTILPGSMATREGLRMRACEAIVQKDAALVFALTQITKASPDKAPDDATIEGAYELFFPGAEAPDEVVAALGDVAGQGDKALESWRLVLLTLCLSPDWQLL
jgi:hypothetical protein